MKYPRSIQLLDILTFVSFLGIFAVPSIETIIDADSGGLAFVIPLFVMIIVFTISQNMKLRFYAVPPSRLFTIRIVSMGMILLLGGVLWSRFDPKRVFGVADLSQMLLLPPIVLFYFLYMLQSVKRSSQSRTDSSLDKKG